MLTPPRHIRTLLLAVILLVPARFAFAGGQAAQSQGGGAAEGDSLTVSLLTCDPGDEAYSLYGHTALRVQDHRRGTDWTFNYGVFNFRKPFFVLRFALGLTDYELGVVPMGAFRQEYQRTGRGVTEQVLNLTRDEKRRLMALLAVNLQPENVVYRYNYFYDNCTTRARDIVEHAIHGTLSYPSKAGAGAKQPSWRELIHGYTEAHPWDACGNDLCLGLKADRATTWRERQFLPLTLMGDFDKALIVDPDGTPRPLVKESRTLMAARPASQHGGFPLTPLRCSVLLLCVTWAATLWERRGKRRAWAFDALLMAAQGTMGCAATLLLFSQHPTTSTNLQALVLNPLPLFFIYKAARRRHTRYWAWMAMLCMLFLAGAVWQDYAEGMTIVALSLLIRCGANLAWNGKKHYN